LLITANPGCLMQIDSALRRQGEPLALAHTIEVLDASIRGADIRSIGVRSAR
jgi:glycolate oxidase iron-sulfur subunit